MTLAKRENRFPLLEHLGRGVKTFSGDYLYSKKMQDVSSSDAQIFKTRLFIRQGLNNAVLVFLRYGNHASLAIELIGQDVPAHRQSEWVDC